MDFINIRDYAGCNVRIEPTGFDIAQSRHGRMPRMWAKYHQFGIPVLLRFDRGGVPVARQ